MKKYLVLYFDAVMQAWGGEESVKFKKTSSFPTKSAVAGIIMRAMGSKEQLILDKINNMRLFSLNIGLHKNFTRNIDYQIIGANKFNRLVKDSDSKKNNSKGKLDKEISYREYLQNTICISILESDDHEFLLDIYKSLKSPQKILCLGRYKCLPSSPIFHGDGLFEDLSVIHESLINRINLEKQIKINGDYMVRGQIDCYGLGDYYIKDIAINREKREYLYRQVNEIYCPLNKIKLEIEKNSF